MKIIASIAGYGGAGAKPITLAATRDDATGIMTVLKEVKHREEAPAGYAFVTNVRLPNYDCLFTEENLQAAIQAYREGEGLTTFILADEVARNRPRIETDGIDPKGQKYRLAADLTNGEMAVLALAYFQSRQRAVVSLTGQMDKIANLYDILSI